MKPVPDDAMCRLAFLLICCGVVRAEAGVTDVADLLGPIRAQHDVPALGGAIVHGDKMVAVGVTGVRKLGSDAKVTAKDRWHLGSCTKSMTATLVAKHVERGRLTWESTLEETFPDLKAIDAAYRPVTIGQLLCHLGGAPADLGFDGLWARLWKREGTTPEQRRILTEGVLRRPPVHKPGTKYLYSNAGFAIVGHALERKTGKSWEELMRAELFTPLRMTSAGFGAPGTGLDQPWGHAVRNGKVVPVAPGPSADNPPAIGPAGTVHASLEDWAKYISLHLGAARGGTENLLLERETLRHLHTPPKGHNYAYGWIVTRRPWAGGTALTHAGSNTMWYCVAWLAPKRNFAVLATCNQGGNKAAVACDEVAGALIRYFGRH